MSPGHPGPDPESTLPPRGTTNKGLGAWNRAACAALLVAALGALAMLHAVAPTRIRAIPPCPFHAATGMFCPGCGSTRATHHLLNARVGEACRHNPVLVVAGAPIGAWALLNLAMLAVCGRRARSVRLPARTGWVALAGLIVFAAARNVPLPVFEPLRPPPTTAP